MIQALILDLKKMKQEISLLKKWKNELMSKKTWKVCRALNYFEHFLIFISAVIDCVSICTFPSLVGVPVGITISAVGLKICAITARKLQINHQEKRARSNNVISKK